MTKLYKCAKGCGSVEETDSSDVPMCCDAPMIEISEDEMFGCGGCCACCGSCGSDGDDEKKEDK